MSPLETAEDLHANESVDCMADDSRQLASESKNGEMAKLLPSIAHFQRKPFENQFSMECLFENLRNSMRELGHDVVALEAPYHSKGFWRRVANMVWAARHRRDVNHITGDVHYLALGLPRSRTILTIHDCHSLERLRGWKRWLLRLFWYDLPIRRAAVVTVISEETKRQLLRHVRTPEHRIEVVPNAVGRIFKPCPRPFRAECPQILQIGTRSNKNVSRLVQALQGLDCRLKIIGPLDQELRDSLARSGISYDAVTQLDEAGMFRAYCECDIVSFVSTYEGFGMPIVEAQAVERPVVTSNCSSMPEVAGEGACLVDPFDVGSIRQGFERVINDRAYRESLVEHGRANRQRFDGDQVARRYIELYTSDCRDGHDRLIPSVAI
jgi:glycosyltransferase involved in cell wall biosynthesis